MSLFDTLNARASDEARAQGKSHFSSGAVHIKTVSERSLAAQIRTSSGVFFTNLSWSSEVSFGYSCTCSDFRRRPHPCGHLVALLLAGRTGGYLPGPQPQRTASNSSDDADETLEGAAAVNRPPLPTWKKHIAALEEAFARKQRLSHHPEQEAPWPPGRQLVYIVDVPSSDHQTLVLKVAYRDRRRSGEWSKPRSKGIILPDLSELGDPTDRQIMAMLKGSAPRQDFQNIFDPVFRVPDAMRPILLPMMAQSGRAYLRTTPEGGPIEPLLWDDQGSWEFWLEGKRDEENHLYALTGSLRRNDQRHAVAEPLLVSAGGVVFWKNRLSLLEERSVDHWIALLRRQKTISVPFAQSHELVQSLISLPVRPRLDLPDDLRIDEITAQPRPRLRVMSPDSRSDDRLLGELTFDYAGTVVPGVDAHHGEPRPIFQPEHKRIILRDAAVETGAVHRLLELGLRPAQEPDENGNGLRNGHRRNPISTSNGNGAAPRFAFPSRLLPRIVRSLVDEKWHVEAEGKLYRQPSDLKMQLTSKIDWFELQGEVRFGDQIAKLPELLAAIKRGDSMVRLGDGTYGMLPEEWMRKYGLLAATGQADDDGAALKFKKNQVGLLDALLASQPDIVFDDAFAAARDHLHQFAGVLPTEPVPTFQGQLRPYQKEGLGWFSFLRAFGFGGCLADDMGLGKTVQVLALLEERRVNAATLSPGTPGEGNGTVDSPRPGLGEGPSIANPKSQIANPLPSLAVVPKSLVFNWKQEAARFAPGLRVLDHTGIERAKSAGEFASYDLILTTYGTLRRDAAFFKDVNFDYIILDEAHAVKNSVSESAKAVRLLKGGNRLALSGTPVQNHLGELWSLFEFLNPGMLGAASVFQLNNGSQRLDEPTRDLLSRALRPFILRRTKEQVARDLPEKLEQTIYCEMEPAQRKLYDELREHFRVSLLSRVDRDGLNQSRMQILEALLRLRQAACHPGLIDPARIPDSSAKLDMLLPQLREVMDEGHKALVFSQFTSFLSILRKRLDHEKIPYEYLDGKTRDRQQRVEHFQGDGECKLFLISLKAGGLGLNLTAADYVFLLDPWWNPAIEAQAIDRAHRIGQTRRVYACRLIAKDTVEEKVLALQKTKRDLADAIINADNSLIRTLGREDLELLLS